MKLCDHHLSPSVLQAPEVLSEVLFLGSLHLAHKNVSSLGICELLQCGCCHWCAWLGATKDKSHSFTVDHAACGAGNALQEQ